MATLKLTAQRRRRAQDERRLAEVPPDLHYPHRYGVSFESSSKPGRSPLYRRNPCTTEWSMDLTNQSGKPWAVEPDMTRLEQNSQFRTNPLGEVTAARVGSFGQGYSLSAIRAMEGYRNNGAFAYYGAKPTPKDIRGGRVTARVVDPRGGEWVKQEPPALFSDGAPVTMYPYRLISRQIVDANPLDY